MASSLLMVKDLTTVSDNSTVYARFAGSSFGGSMTEAQLECPVRHAGTFKNLSVYVSANDVGSNSTYTLRKSRAATSLVATITASTTGLFEDVSNTVSVATTDEVDFQVVVSSVAGNHSVSFVHQCVEFVPDTTSNTVTYMVCGRSSAQAASVSSSTYFACPNSRMVLATSAEGDFGVTLQNSYTWEGLYAYVTASSAP